MTMSTPVAARLLRFDLEALEAVWSDVVYVEPSRLLELVDPPTRRAALAARARLDAGEAFVASPRISVAVRDGLGIVIGGDGADIAAVALELGIQRVPLRVERSGAGVIERVRRRGEDGSGMPWTGVQVPRWRHVEAAEGFGVLPLQEKLERRRAYFREFIAPTLPPSRVDEARCAWEQAWRPIVVDRAALQADVEGRRLLDDLAFGPFRREGR